MLNEIAKLEAHESDINEEFEKNVVSQKLKKSPYLEGKNKLISRGILLVYNNYQRK